MTVLSILSKIAGFFKNLVNAGLVTENDQLKNKIDSLENLLKLDLTLNETDGFYYKKNSKIPYCPRCFNVDKVACPLKIKGDPHYQDLKCPNCKEYYKN